MFNHKAQGTIEYLVILSVVVVIALIIISLMTNLFSSPSEEITNSASTAGEATSSGISVVESVTDSSGNALIRLSNNSSDAITLKRISTDDVDNNYNTTLVGLDSKGFSLSGLASSCPCESGQKSIKCEFKIEYLTSTGITKTETKLVSIQCVNNTTAKNPEKIVEPIINEITLEDGTIENPWIINDCLELQNMNQHLDGNYILGNDINCYNDTHEGGVLYNEGAGFEPIGDVSSAFNGNLDGEGYLITGLFINRPLEDYVGLFSKVMGTGNYETIFSKTGGDINNLGVVDANISGRSYIGIIVGYLNHGTINQCYSSGYLFAHNLSENSNELFGGGLVGYAAYGAVQNSYSLATLFGESSCSTDMCYSVINLGGLIGKSEQNQTLNSYAVNTITGNSTAPLGEPTTNLKGLIAVDTASTGWATNSYWNFETGQPLSALGEGKTTSQMKSQNTFEDWDFIQIWKINEGVSYPELSWQ